MTGFEPAASCSQSRRATNCATPGYEVVGWPGRILPKQARYQLRYTRIFCLAVWKHRLGNIIIYAAKDCKYPIKYVMMLL